MSFTLSESMNTANTSYGWIITRPKGSWVPNHDHSRWWTIASWLLGIATVVVYIGGGL